MMWYLLGKKSTFFKVLMYLLRVCYYFFWFLDFIDHPPDEDSTCSLDKIQTFRDQLCIFITGIGIEVAWFQILEFRRNFSSSASGQRTLKFFGQIWYFHVKQVNKVWQCLNLARKETDLTSRMNIANFLQDLSPSGMHSFLSCFVNCKNVIL